MNTDYPWISRTSGFYQLHNDIYKLEIRWSKNVCKDFIKLSNEYYRSAYKICSEIVGSANDNQKNDMWFLPCVYLLRQSIELLLKAGLAKEINHKRELQNQFIEAKHDLPLLFEGYKMHVNNLDLSIEEVTWLEKYLVSLEIIDKNSDLFRYPFKDKFLSQYKNKFLDIVVILNRLLQCYDILSKTILGHTYKTDEVNLEDDPEFLSFESHGFGNCHLFESPYSNSFYKQIIGYSKTGEFLFKLYQKEGDICYVYPMIFLYRNAIELALKRLLYANTDIKVEDYKLRRIRNTHLLYKDLWRNIKPVLKHYADKQGQDLIELDIAEKYINEINTLDKNGDMFRYPCTYSFEYKFNRKIIDVKNVYTYLQSIFNFLDSCNCMLESISDFESEMRDYYDVY